MDYMGLKEFLDGADYLYNCAGAVSFSPREKDNTINININGTKNIINASLECGIKKMCHVSSVAALGYSDDNNLINENYIWTSDQKDSIYSLSKFHGEMEVWRGMEEGLNAVIVNPSIIVGPGDWNSSSCVFFPLIKNGFRFYPPGSFGFVDVRDVAEIMIKLMESDITNERFVINSENITYKEFFDMIANAFQVKSPNILVPKFLASTAVKLNYLYSLFTSKKQQLTKETINSAFSNSAYSSDKVKRMLNYSFIPIKDTIKHTATFYNMWKE